jgi:hypothetical protein
VLKHVKEQNFLLKELLSRVSSLEEKLKTSDTLANPGEFHQITDIDKVEEIITKISDSAFAQRLVSYYLFLW